jgi:hypothetical protein
LTHCFQSLFVAQAVNYFVQSSRMTVDYRAVATIVAFRPPTPVPPDSGVHRHDAVLASHPVPPVQEADDRANRVSAKRGADRDSSGVPSDLADLRAEQVNDLKDTVTAFDLFLAAAAQAADEPDQVVDDPISDTTVLLLSEGLQQRLDHLRVIRADNWPAVEWATPIGTMVVQAQGHLERYQHCAQGLDHDDDRDVGASADDCPQLKDLCTSIEALRKHITGHYQSLCPASPRGNRK